MKKRVITLISLSLILALLIGGVALMGHFNEKKAAADAASEETESTEITVTAKNASDITEISFEREGVALTFTKDSDGEWHCEGSDLPMKASVIGNMVSALSPLTAARDLGTEDPGTYGLDTPSLTVTAVYGEEKVELVFGNINGFNSRIYLKNVTGGHIYLADSSVTDPFDRDFEDFVSTDSLPAGLYSEGVTAITVRDETGAENVISDETGIENAFSLIEAIDFSPKNCYHTDKSDYENYGISESGAMIEITYKEDSDDTDDTDGSDGTSSAPAATRRFTVFFGKNHETEVTLTDDDGNSYPSTVQTYYYTVSDGRLVYSLDSGAYEDLMELVSYVPEDTESEEAEG